MDQLVVDNWTPESGYAAYRGKCREYCERAIKQDPSLTIVRGYYYEPIWGTIENHWWCVQSDGSIYDPTKDQFPSRGNGHYEEFNGFYSCEQCGEEVAEADMIPCGNYPCCSNKCAMRLVGL